MTWATVGVVAAVGVLLIVLAIAVYNDRLSDSLGIIGLACLTVAVTVAVVLGAREVVWRYDRGVCAEYGRLNAVEVEFVFYGFWTWDCREIDP